MTGLLQMHRIAPKTVLNALHNSAVFGRRVRVLAKHLAEVIPGGGRVLDLGSGDGSIAAALMSLRPDLSVEGVDVMLRPKTKIPVTAYDGVTLPFADQSFDYVTIVDVLHHTSDPAAILREARRIVRQGIVVKDHLLEGMLAGPTLRVMDWVGNRGHDIVLPYNYLSAEQWRAAFDAADLAEVSSRRELAIYPMPFSLLFDRSLHFVSYLARR